MIYYVNLKVEPTLPTVPVVPSGPAPAPKAIEDSAEKLFREVAGEDMEVDWMELKRILDHSMRDGSVSVLRPIRIKRYKNKIHGKILILFRVRTTNGWN